MSPGNLFLLLGVAALHTAVSTEAFDVTKSYRCKCVCPRGLDKTANQSVFIAQEADPRECECPHVVINATLEFCLQCKCRVESFNSVLIKVIIVFILVSFAGLLGLGIWQCALELYQRRQKPLSVSARDVMLPERSMSPVTEVESSTSQYSLQGDDTTGSEVRTVHRPRNDTALKRTVNSVKNNLIGAHSELQRQRDYVYERHTLLS